MTRPDQIATVDQALGLLTDAELHALILFTHRAATRFRDSEYPQPRVAELFAALTITAADVQDDRRLWLDAVERSLDGDETEGIELGALLNEQDWFQDGSDAPDQ